MWKYMWDKGGFRSRAGPWGTEKEKGNIKASWTTKYNSQSSRFIS